jgi:hypothetical protein
MGVEFDLEYDLLLSSQKCLNPSTFSWLTDDNAKYL